MASPKREAQACWINCRPCLNYEKSSVTGLRKIQRAGVKLLESPVRKKLGIALQLDVPTDESPGRTLQLRNLQACSNP